MSFAVDYLCQVVVRHIDFAFQCQTRRLLTDYLKRSPPTAAPGLPPHPHKKSAELFAFRSETLYKNRIYN